MTRLGEIVSTSINSVDDCPVIRLAFIGRIGEACVSTTFIIQTVKMGLYINIYTYVGRKRQRIKSILGTHWIEIFCAQLLVQRDIVVVCLLGDKKDREFERGAQIGASGCD